MLSASTAALRLAPASNKHHITCRNNVKPKVSLTRYRSWCSKNSDRERGQVDKLLEEHIEEVSKMI